MTSVVRRERARQACLTGTTGLLVILTAVVMMIAAAPRGHSRPHHGAGPAATRLAADVTRTGSGWVVPQAHPALRP